MQQNSNRVVKNRLFNYLLTVVILVTCVVLLSIKCFSISKEYNKLKPISYIEADNLPRVVDSLYFDSVVVDGIKTDTLTISPGTFNMETFVLLTADTNVVKRVTGWDHIGYATGLTVPGFIWISNPFDRGLVSHELLHGAWNTLTFSQVEVSGNTDEVLAYELSRMTNEFYNKFYNK